MSGTDQALRLLESLVYAENEDALAQSDRLVTDYLQNLKSANKEQLEAQKGTVQSLDKAYAYLINHKRLPVDHFALPALEFIFKERGWEKHR
jgi:hypothetical protein